MAINLTVLKYIVALDTHRNFVRAAEACNVTQPSLSTAVSKFEDELDIQIFDRNSHPIKPTVLGGKIVTMARKTLLSANQIEEFVLTTRGEETGEFALGILPTIAPYILADLFHIIEDRYPKINLRVEELRTELAIKKILNAELDAVIMSTPLDNDLLLEIPLYYEKFLAYISPTDPLYMENEVQMEALATDRMWLMEEGHCLRNQVVNFCHVRDNAQFRYQAGSVATLINIVDKNGGYTIIPQLHSNLLLSEQIKNIRPIVGQEENCTRCIPHREISLVIRKDYIRERMLNIMAQTIKSIIPEEMLDERLKKYAIKI